MGGTRWEVISSLDTIQGFADEFRDLAESTGVAPSAKWESIKPWLRNRPDVQPIAIRVLRGSETVGFGILAAMRRHGVWRVGKAGTVGEPYGLLYAHPDDLDALGAGIRRALDDLVGPWSLRVSDLSSDAVEAERLAEELPHSRLSPGPLSPRLNVGADQTPLSVLSRNTRSAVAKARNRIKAEGRVLEAVWVEQAYELKRHLDDIVEICARRNASLNRDRVADEAELPTFRETILEHARTDHARVLLVQIDGVTAAFAVCLHNADEAFVFSNAVSPDFLRYSAGTIANAEVVRANLERPGVQVVNWGAGIQRYKLSGPVTITQATTLSAWSSTSTMVFERAIPRITRSVRSVRLTNTSSTASKR